MIIIWINQTQIYSCVSFLYFLSMRQKKSHLNRMNYDLPKRRRLWTVARQIQTDCKRASVSQNILPPSTVVGLIIFFPVQTEPGPIDIVSNVCNVINGSALGTKFLHSALQIQFSRCSQRLFAITVLCETSFWWNVFCHVQKSTSSENQINRQRRAIQENKYAALTQSGFCSTHPATCFPADEMAA